MPWSYRAPPELSDEQYTCWTELLEERAGICFSQHKSILQKGLSSRMREVGVESYEEYLGKVTRIPEGAVEWSLLVDRVSVKETSFFRDSKSFDVVRRFLEERLQESVSRQDYTLDLWSVGCSTGCDLNLM